MVPEDPTLVALEDLTLVVPTLVVPEDPTLVVLEDLTLVVPILIVKIFNECLDNHLPPFEMEGLKTPDFWNLINHLSYRSLVMLF